MNRHAKAPSVGSSTRQGSRQGAVHRGALALALALVAFLGIGASAALAAAPSVSVEAAEVGFTSAEAKGTIDPGGEGASYHYEYVTDAKYNENVGNGHPGFYEGAEYAGFNFIPAAGPAEPVQLGVATPVLAAGTTYHLRLVAENGGGETSSATIFTTQSATPAPVTIDPVGTPGYTSVHVSGTVNPESGNVNPIGPTPVPIAWEFQVNREGQGWEMASGTPAGSQVIEGAEAESPTALTVEEEIEGLVPGPTYEIRLRSFRAGAESVSAEPFESFATLAGTAPSASAPAAGSLTASSATLSATVNPNAPEAAPTSADVEAAFHVSWHFEYSGDAGAHWTATSVQGLAADNSGHSVEANVTGLEPHKPYLIKVVAKNAGGTTTSTNGEFTTAAVPPTVTPLNAIDLTGEGATLRGQVNPHNSATTYYFLWGTEDCSANPCQSIPVSEDAAAGSGGAPVLAHQELTGLSPETTYHYVLVAESPGGSVETPDRIFTTVAPAAGCPNEARRQAQGSTALPDCRAYEMVSPPQKFGADVVAHTQRIRAATGGSAIEFLSFGAFADASSVPYPTEYIAERNSAEPTGWSTHAITPPQDSLSYFSLINGAEPLYQSDFSADLTKGIFKSWSPLTAAANVAEVPGALYLRDDLRTPGAGHYQLLSDANQPLQLPEASLRTVVAASSADFNHVIFTTQRPLRANSDRENVKLYKSDAPGVPRLLIAGPNCGFQPSPRPCSDAGRGAFRLFYTDRTISSDGSRAEFTAPVVSGSGQPTETPGAASRIFQLDDQGTADPTDDALIQLDSSEVSNPGFTRIASFQYASSDGNRVFFISPEELVTGASNGGLYMWQRQDENETQRLSVDASAGTFTLTAHAWPTRGAGNLVEGSKEVKSISAGSFMVGQTVSGPGIPPGATIAQMRNNSNRLVLSQAATATVAGAEIEADNEATTPPLAFDATAAQVQSALEALATAASPPEEQRPLLGAGNVQVSGGPGSAGAATPYDITFTGALAGVDVAQLTADGSALSGGAGTASVATTSPLHNLSLVAATEANLSAGVIGASEDGHRLYFANAGGQLVAGAPSIGGSAFYYWQDADGIPGGTLSFVGGVNGGGDVGTNDNGISFTTPKTSRVSPDGRHLLFEVADGSQLAPGYDQLHCNAENANSTSVGCSEAYLYSAETSTPTEPDLVCASCDPSGRPATASAWLQERRGAGGAASTNHLSQALSDDGRYAFFSTAEALVPADTNGVEDAYVYDTVTERPRLLSSGTDPAPSYFADASADGRDAFILTRQRLVGWDTDGSSDLYDVRVDGGLPEPPPPPPAPCNGEGSCRESAPPTPSASATGSGNIGPGNQRQPRRGCPHGKRAVTKRGKTRCLKKHARHHRAGAGRGVSK